MTASWLKIVADRRHGLSRATLYFRRSAENQQIFNSSPEASRPLQPPRRLSSGIRPTEQTACCPPASSDFGQLDGRVRQIKSEPGAMHNIHEQETAPSRAWRTARQGRPTLGSWGYQIPRAVQYIQMCAACFLN